MHRDSVMDSMVQLIARLGDELYTVNSPQSMGPHLRALHIAIRFQAFNLIFKYA